MGNSLPSGSVKAQAAAVPPDLLFKESVSHPTAVSSVFLSTWFLGSGNHAENQEWNFSFPPQCPMKEEHALSSCLSQGGASLDSVSPSARQEGEVTLKHLVLWGGDPSSWGSQHLSFLPSV